MTLCHWVISWWKCFQKAIFAYCSLTASTLIQKINFILMCYQWQSKTHTILNDILWLQRMELMLYLNALTFHMDICQNFWVYWVILPTQSSSKIWKGLSKKSQRDPTDPTQAIQTQLIATIQQIFHDIQEDPTLQDLLSYTMAESIKTKPTWPIHQWVNNCHNHICNHCKAAKIRAKLCTHDIRQYLNRNIRPQPSTSDKNLMWPPKMLNNSVGLSPCCSQWL